MSWGSDVDTSGSRVGYYAQDLTVTDGGEPILAYTQHYDAGGTGESVGSRIVQVEVNQGNPQEAWGRAFTGVQDHETKVLALDIDDSGYLTAVGSHDIDFQFAGTSLRDPGSDGTGVEAFALNFGPLSSGSRNERWGKSFGSFDTVNGAPHNDGDNIPADVAVDPSNGDIAIVGNYDDKFYSLGGTVGSQATNDSIFIQTLDRNGLNPDSLTSGTGTGDDSDPRLSPRLQWRLTPKIAQSVPAGRPWAPVSILAAGR